MTNPTRIVLALLVCLMALPGCARERLVLLHTNDTHGRLTASGEAEGPAGGMARLATAVARVREEVPGRVLLLHAGDILSRGEPATVYYGGDVDIAVMNAIGFDAFTPGNGDLYFGLSNLQRVTSGAAFPALHANMVDRGTRAPVFAPYAFANSGRVRVAVLGLGFIRLEHPSAAGLDLLDAVETARQYVPKLAAESDLVVVISHLGLLADRELASAVPDIDVIVGGHTHDLLTEPVIVDHPSGRPVWIVQAGDYGRYLGRLDLVVARRQSGAHIVQASGRVLPMDESVPEDPSILALLAAWAAPLDEPVGELAEALDHSAEGASPLGDAVLDAMIAVSRSDAALLDRGALAAGLPAGAVTRADLCRAHPWRNEVYVVEMDAQAFQAAASQAGVLSAKSDAVEDLNVLQKLRVAVGSYLYATTPSMAALPAHPTGTRIDEVLAEVAAAEAATR